MDAFISRIPKLRIRLERISDEEVERSNERILGTIHETNSEELPSLGDKRDVDKENTGAVTKEETALNPQLKEALMSVKIYQYRRSSTEIAKLTGKPLSTFSRILEQLERNNLVMNMETRIGKRNYKFPVLTEKGYEALGLPEEKVHTRGGGPEHTIQVNMIAENFEKDKPLIEHLRVSKFVDLHFEIDGLTIAIEVERSQANVLNNVTEDFAVGYDYVVVVGKDKKTVEDLKKVLEGSVSESVSDKLNIMTIEGLLALKDIRRLIASK